ncbi:hypothetical protein OAD66_07535 [Bacteroidia bacterium]|nr:hypothetical protein [Bacteroidia bacterium]MDB9882968.1 hypothetical protein [Bacteroidia bacterium]
MLNLILYIFFTLIPQHDFHTSWMNMTYNEKNKEFEITWRTDTEHLEGALSAFSKDEIHLENTSVNTHKILLNKYITANTNLYFNGKNQKLEIDVIEVTFAETTVHFRAIKCRRKLKTVAMNNTLLQALFPNQKNMVQVNYKGKMHSMLLGGSKLFEEISIP